MDTSNFVEYRCRESKKLLFRADGHGEVEIINPTNHVMNYLGPDRPEDHIGLKGASFTPGAYDMRCACCHRMQGRARGIDFFVEIKCRYCHTITLHDMFKIHNEMLATMSTEQKKLYYSRYGYGAKVV